ncbi:MAG: MauE/DoxX family redox-associated membrane protein [Elusimicrobiales bacterium]
MSFKQRAFYVSPFMRIMVGLVLVYSGCVKIIEPVESFYSAILSYKIIGQTIAYYTALFLPWFEFYLGIFVIFGLFERYVIKASILLFIIFELLLLQAIIRRLEITSCGCFGPRHSNPIGVEFLLNIIWLFFLWISYKFSSKFSLDHLIEKKFGL